MRRLYIVLTICLALLIPVGAFTAEIVTVTVASGGTDSSPQKRPQPQFYTVEIHAPGVLAEAATITASPTDSGTFSTLQSGGADISIAATKVIIISPAPEYLKIHLGGAAAQARIFTFVWK